MSPSAQAVPREDGFTLIELVVSLTVLAIAMGAIGQMFLTSLKTASTAAHRTDAVALAERDIEAMRSIPYAQLGFSSSQSGFSSAFVDGATTYTTVQVAQPQLPPVAPPVVLSGVSYTLTRAIYWVGADRFNSTNLPEAYKQATVIVSWSDPGGADQVRQEGVIYPGGVGAYIGRQGGSTTTSTTTNVGAPAAPTLGAALDIRNPSTTINLSWTGAADHWQVQYSTDAFLTVNVVANGLTATTYQITGRAPLSVYQFRVGAYSVSGAGPTYSNIVTQTTASGTPGVACAVTSVTVTPTPVARAPGLQSLLGDVRVSVITTGPCTVISARYTPTTAPTLVYLVADASYTNWSGTLSGLSTSRALGHHQITIWNELTTLTLNSTGGVTVTT